MGMRERYLEDTGRSLPDNDYDNKRDSGIRNLNIRKKALMLLAGGAVLALVTTNPYVQGTVKFACDSFAEYDNAKFEEESQRIHDEVVELTGDTPEEIMERGRHL